MPETWSISGGDLHVDIAGARVRAGLETALRDAVRSGRLRPGTRLPSSRALAADLGVARNTVAEAYGQLVAEGWLTARAGSGTRVAHHVGTLPRADRERGETAARLRYSLRPGVPDAAAFPRGAWLRAMRRALAAARPEAFLYPDPQGVPALRAVLAEYLARARGVDVAPDRIIICAGFAQGLARLASVLRKRRAMRLGIEAFGHALHRQIAIAAGLRLRDVPVDARGATVGHVRDVDALLLTPAHQMPLGVALAPERRTQAIEWARQSGALIIEDDYDGEFRYDRRPLGAMQALGPDRVVYAGTTSKALAPALRLAWLVVPPALVVEVAEAQRLLGAPSGIDQLALTEFIAAGDYDRHVRSARLAYRRRRDRLVAVLEREAPDVRVRGIEAGLHVVVALPRGRSEHDVIAAAAARGLALEGLSTYASGAQEHAPALVVGYGTPPDHAFAATVARLCATLSAT